MSLKKQIKELTDKIDALNDEKELLVLKIKQLQRKCSHPNAWNGTDISGCSEMSCPDCGYSN